MYTCLKNDDNAWVSYELFNCIVCIHATVSITSAAVRKTSKQFIILASLRNLSIGGNMLMLSPWYSSEAFIFFVCAQHTLAPTHFNEHFLYFVCCNQVCESWSPMATKRFTTLFNTENNLQENHSLSISVVWTAARPVFALLRGISVLSRPPGHVTWWKWESNSHTLGFEADCPSHWLF